MRVVGLVVAGMNQCICSERGGRDLYGIVNWLAGKLENHGRTLEDLYEARQFIGRVLCARCSQEYLPPYDVPIGSAGLSAAMGILASRRRKAA